MRTENLNAHGIFLFVQDHLDFAPWLSFRQAPVVVPEFFGVDRVGDARLRRPLFVHADAGKFRVRVRAPRKPGVVDFSRQVENRIGHHDAPFVARSVGELIGPRDVARGKDMSLGGPHPVVHDDALAAEGHADPVEA